MSPKGNVILNDLWKAERLKINQKLTMHFEWKLKEEQCEGSVGGTGQGTSPKRQIVARPPRAPMA